MGPIAARAVTGVVGAALVAAGALPAPSGAAAEPLPGDRTVLRDLHTDAISTFWETGRLVLGTKADLPDGERARFEPDEVLFHVDGDARIADLPAGYEFVAPEGSTIWLAPMTQDPDVLWPGFSTESVPEGVLDDDQVGFTLEHVEGPGDVELWVDDVFGAVGERLWSSDEDVKSFTRTTNTHLHANWAFTQPGVYDLTVRATGAVEGVPTADTATYTFLVGPGESAGKATPTVAVRPAKQQVRRGTKAPFVVKVTADGVTPTGKVTVTVLGRSATARLAGGKATLRVAIPERARLGRAKVVAAYAGDPHVKSGRDTATVRIVR